MTDIPLRARRRIEDLAVRWEERQDRSDRQRQQQADLRRSRMSSDRVRTATQSQEWTGSMGMSPSSRLQIVEEAGKKTPVFSREGIRWNVAWGLVVGIAMLMGVILLADLSGIGISMRSINRLNNRIEMVTEKNEQITDQLSRSDGDMNILTEAVKLNLIGSGGARTVRLTAPTGAVLQLSRAEPPAGD